MTDQAQVTRVVLAGWYQDPAAPEKVRWWNGLAWTDHTADKPTEAQRIADARALEREFGISTAENAIMTGGAQLALGSTASATPATAAASASTVRVANTSTTAVWLLAFMPAFAAAIAAAAAYIYFYIAPTPLVIIAAVVLWLLGFLWANSDVRVLEARGIDAPKPAWALIGALVFLVIRRLKVAGSGPLIAFVLIALVAIGAPLGVVLAGGAGQVTTALDIQRTLHTELVETGKLASVSCPPLVESSNAGALFTCSATASDGSPKDVWVSFDDSEGHFSYAIDIR